MVKQRLSDSHNLRSGVDEFMSLLLHVLVTFNTESIHIIPQSTSEFRKYQLSESHTLFGGVKQCQSAPSKFILGQ
jgi:hypothetical protein